jgi:hypothetical protein
MLPETSETCALIANDIRALVSQLNERMEQAAQEGLRVECTSTVALDLRTKVSSYPSISVRVLAEIQ